MLAFAFCLSIIRGWLIPKSAVDQMQTNHDKRVEEVAHDRTEWRAAHRISETARLVSADQVNELLEHARTTDSFIRSLPHPGGQVTP